MVDDFGTMTAAVYGVVPWEASPMQTIADAEDYVMSVLPVVAQAPFTVYIDRQATVDTARGHQQMATGPGHPRSHMWGKFFAAFDGDDQVQVVKTKGHATEEDVNEGRTTHWERRGNRKADELAKAGAAMHGLSKQVMLEMQALKSIGYQAHRWAAEVRVAGQPAAKDRGSGGKRCKRGRKRRTDTPNQPRKRVRVEPGQDAGVQREWKQLDCDGRSNLHHSLHLARVLDSEGKSRGSLAFCAKCGAYFWRGASNLSKPCGKPHRGQKSRISAGRFPSASAK
eukprot:8435154-Karenia_brevis.AAC.1